MLKPKCQGRRFWGKTDLDGWLSWAVYESSVTDEEIEDQWYRCYGGPGQYFQHGPSIWRTNTRVLVTMGCGYDC